MFSINCVDEVVYPVFPFVCLVGLSENRYIYEFGFLFFFSRQYKRRSCFYWCLSVNRKGYPRPLAKDFFQEGDLYQDKVPPSPDKGTSLAMTGYLRLYRGTPARIGYSTPSPMARELLQASCFMYSWRLILTNNAFFHITNNIHSSHSVIPKLINLKET